MYSSIKLNFILVLIFAGIKVLAFVPDSFRADFENSYVSQATGKVKKSTGKLTFKNPDNIRFEVLSPDNLLFISNKTKSWYYRPPFADGEAGELKIGKPDPYHFLEFFKALSGGLKDGKAFKVEKSNDYSELNFQKNFSDQYKISKAKLFFTGKDEFTNLNKIEITYTDKKVVTIQLSNIQKNPELKESEFNFTPPENTTITK